MNAETAQAESTRPWIAPVCAPKRLCQVGREAREVAAIKRDGREGAAIEGVSGRRSGLLALDTPMSAPPPPAAAALTACATCGIAPTTGMPSAKT